MCGDCVHLKFIDVRSFFATSFQFDAAPSGASSISGAKVGCGRERTDACWPAGTELVNFY